MDAPVKKRKIDGEGRAFNKIWTTKYFFAEVRGKAVCLVCGDQIAVFKDYNLNRHYTTKHADRYKNLTDDARARTSEALLAKLQTQQDCVGNANTPGDAIAKASLMISYTIVKHRKSLSDGEFVKECLMAIAEIMFPEKRDAFERLSLSRPAVTRSIEDIAGNVELQLQHKVDSFDFFSLALSESCDVGDTAQFLVFVRGITKDFKITEELVGVWSTTGTTTGRDLFTKVGSSLDRLGLRWDRLNVMCKSLLGVNHVIEVVNRVVDVIRTRGSNHKQFVALLEEFETVHEDIPIVDLTNMRWLGLGDGLKRFWDLKVKIKEFCKKKGENIPELSDEDWMADLAFAVDITALMNGIQAQLKRKDVFVHDIHSLAKAFVRELQFLSNQLESSILTHVPSLKEVTPSADHLCRYSSMLTALHDEFVRRLEDFKNLEDEIQMILSPFTCNVYTAPTDVQLELIDLQCDMMLTQHFHSASLLDFYSALKEENFPNMRRHAQKMLILFGSTYTCEQTFSLMKSNRFMYGTSLTDDQLSAILRISTTDIQPDFDAIVQAQQGLDVSH
ncbi:general transcription factor II-I repeat domain-containing protein 2-like [Antennarius striatus]|uniref:general transcription factor II-I repeat domain-containing protein 2-like n=1 Tax=Antennarius striatus TaxID=241820 RepID=UPI0035B370E4